MENHVALAAEQSREGRSSTTALLTKAGAQLLDAAGMLRVEAHEWRDRKGSIPRSWDGGISKWADKCERIAAINDRAAASFEATAEKIAQTTAA